MQATQLHQAVNVWRSLQACRQQSVCPLPVTLVFVCHQTEDFDKQAWLLGSCNYVRLYAIGELGQVWERPRCEQNGEGDCPTAEGKRITLSSLLL